MLVGPAIGGVPAGTPFLYKGGGDTMPKPFLTYSDQIALLQAKHMVVSDTAVAESTLRQYGYFSLVSGYKDLLKDPTTRYYRNGTTFEELCAVYRFDESLRELTLRYLLHVERHIRSVLSYAFCNMFGDSQSEYINPNHYDISTARKRAEVSKLINNYIDPLLNGPTNYPYIEHHKSHYGNVPLWVVMNALTFGNVSKMYAYSHSTVKSTVSREFEYINERQLQQILEVLTVYRNVCAHNERLFSYQCAGKDIPDLVLHRKLGIPRRGQQFIYGKHDYFAVVISLRYLLPNDEFLIYKKMLAKLIDDLCKKVNGITQTELLHRMGFPQNWKEITWYKKN